MENLFKEHFETEEWLQDLFDNAHDLIHIVHVEGSILYVNRSWANILGFSQEEIIGKSIYSFIEESDLPFYINYRSNIINRLEPERQVIFRLKTKAGNPVSVEGILSAKFKDQKPIYTRGIFRDVTAKLQNEEQLKLFTRQLEERENNLQQLLINAPDAVIVIDKNSCISFWNPKAEEIFGWTKEEVIDRPLTETIIPTQYREAHSQGMKRYITTGQSKILNKTIEITAIKKNQSEFYVSLTIASTSQKGDLAFIAFIRDITELKNNQLQLENKTRELERSNANLEEFAYAASHDLKEPIRKILTFSDRLKERLKTKLDDYDFDYFNRMENAAGRMASLIDDLLMYSHVSRSTGFLENMDLNRKVNLVMEDLELEIEEKAATVTFDQLPVIKGHKRQIQQLFQNLIGNALKYNRPGIKPVIHISSKLIKGNEAPLHLPLDQYYQIRIEDNGIGFEQKDAEKIFNLFQRLHSKTEYGGTGIGLSIVRKIVENHNGYIIAEGEPGKGAVFTVYLPCI